MTKFWLQHPEKNSFAGVEGKKTDKLPNNFYTLTMNPYTQQLVLDETSLKTGNIVELTTGPAIEILNEIRKFHTLKERFAAKGFNYKRGFLLYGPYGTGKTTILQNIARTALSWDDTVVALFNQQAIITPQVIQKFREYDDRVILILIEDIDIYIRNFESHLLELMDGMTDVCTNMIFVATTNNLEKIPPRLRCRPGRFDTVINVGTYNIDQRKEILSNWLDNASIINELAQQTDGFTVAMLKELVVQTDLLEKHPTQAIEYLRELAASGENFVPENQDDDDYNEDDEDD